ncbi:hypothetical protein [Catellatospora chokoriensis]|uniref:PH domain-containing protein n=1 Tax=Catellatospora chokoriensis TaxID=310353 RepID=A0A8J3NTF8_9ACTN|nr:hypothetical protein [Catellatospora chokoriensis]GIF91663.1 hypothetical protein Cch02nite_51070 [Catellatospora chokoriensis]
MSVPDRAAFAGLGAPVQRYGTRPVAQLLIAPIVAATTLVLGFGADIVPYQIAGIAITVGLLVQALLIHRNRAIHVYERGMITVGALGRVQHVVTWHEVAYVEGVTVNTSNGAFTTTRRDFTVHVPGGRVRFNDLLVADGDRLAAHIALRAGQRRLF